MAGSAMPGTSSVTSATTRVATDSTPGSAAMRGSRLDGARLSDGEHVGKPRGLVVGGARPLQRVEVRQIRDEHRDARRDDRGDRQRLPLHLPQIAKELAIERAKRAGIVTIGAPAR